MADLKFFYGCMGCYLKNKNYSFRLKKILKNN